MHVFLKVFWNTARTNFHHDTKQVVHKKISFFSCFSTVSSNKILTKNLDLEEMP